MTVVVVGDGIVGRSVAWRLAREGAQVTVVDPDPSRSAARVAAGMLAPISEAAYGEDDLLALGLASAGRWPSFAAEVSADAGCDAGYVETETLVVEYADAEALARRTMPRRRLSTLVRPDGSTLTTTIVRTAEPERDQEQLVRQTCLRSIDRSRVEEEESILRVQDRARYDLFRHEFDPKKGKKSLAYRYPWLPHTFYERVYAKLVDFAMSTDAWAAAV